MKCLFLYGLPGTGKRTIGRELERMTGYPLLDNHKILDLVRPIIPRKYPQSNRLSRAFRIQILEHVLEMEYEGIIMTAAGGAEGATEHVRDCTRLIEGRGGAVHFIELNCADEVLRERIQHPDRKGGTKMVDPSLLDEFMQKGYFRGLPERPFHEVDTTHRTPNQSAEHILQLLAQ